MAEYLSISLLRNTSQLFRHYRFNLQYAPVGVAEGGVGAAKCSVREASIGIRADGRGRMSTRVK